MSKEVHYGFKVRSVCHSGVDEALTAKLDRRQGSQWALDSQVMGEDKARVLL